MDLALPTASSRSALPTPPIYVLSVGRSGTSLVARALGRLGIHLGQPGDLMPASEQNRLGFFEHLDIFEINEAILAAFGGSWYRPPDLAEGWEHDERLSDLRVRAASVTSALAVHGRWGFKDPRTAVTLPFWKAIAGTFEYVVCVRQPEAVISSITATGLPGAEPEMSSALWLRMNAAILRHTTHARRHFVFYEDWFTDADGVYSALADFLRVSMPMPGASMEVFDPSQRRADVSARPHPRHAPIPEANAMLSLMRLSADLDRTAIASAEQDRERAAQIAERLTEAHLRRAG